MFVFCYEARFQVIGTGEEIKRSIGIDQGWKDDNECFQEALQMAIWSMEGNETLKSIEFIECKDDCDDDDLDSIADSVGY